VYTVREPVAVLPSFAMTVTQPHCKEQLKGLRFLYSGVSFVIGSGLLALKWVSSTADCVGFLLRSAFRSHNTFFSTVYHRITDNVL